MGTVQERDRYLFGALESSAKNRAKVQEVNYGFEQPEGVVLTTLDFAINWVPEKLGMAGHLRAGMLRDRDDVDGRLTV